MDRKAKRPILSIKIILQHSDGKIIYSHTCILMCIKIIIIDTHVRKDYYMWDSSIVVSNKHGEYIKNNGKIIYMGMHLSNIVEG